MADRTARDQTKVEDEEIKEEDDKEEESGGATTEQLRFLSLIQERESTRTGSNHCVDCNITLAEKRPYINHMKRHHLGLEIWARLDPEEARRCFCDACDKQFVSTSEINAHVKLCQSQDISGNRSKCNICGKSVKNLSMHVLFMHTPKSYKCEACGSRFPQRCEIRRHIKKNHSGDMDLMINVEDDDEQRGESDLSKCDEKTMKLRAVLKKANESFGQNSKVCFSCDLHFPKRLKLLVHIRKKHLGLDIWAQVEPKKARKSFCEECNIQFASISEMKNHRKSPSSYCSAAGKDKGPYICDTCGKVYLQPGGLRIHVSTVHLKEKNFHCDQCDKSFGRADSLTKHLRTHANERGYICDICSLGFNQSSHLYKHIKMKHSDVSKSALVHVCHLCGTKYGSSGELNRHMKNTHEGVKDYCCLICHKEYGGRSMCQRHVKKVHKIPAPVFNQHFKRLFVISKE